MRMFSDAVPCKGLCGIFAASHQGFLQVLQFPPLLLHMLTVSATDNMLKWMRKKKEKKRMKFWLCQTWQLSCAFIPHITWHVVHDRCLRHRQRRRRNIIPVYPEYRSPPWCNRQTEWTLTAWVSGKSCVTSVGGATEISPSQSEQQNITGTGLQRLWWWATDYHKTGLPQMKWWATQYQQKFWRTTAKVVNKRISTQLLAY